MTETLSNFQVNNRQDFIRFIDLLRQDLIDNPDSWENNKLEMFLEAISSYAESIQSHYDNMEVNVNANEPTWQTFADIFKGATMYE